MFYFLIVLTIASQVGIQGWSTLFTNFAVERAGFGGFEIGVAQSLREVPGFLSLLVVYVLMVLPEHRVVALAIMIFTSDVCLRAGYIVPADKTIQTSEPLLPYFTAASRISFEQYVDEFLLPYVRSQSPGTTKETLLAACTLRGLDGFLRASGNVYVIGNEDDPILSVAELAYLKDVFGGRAAFFKHGGHCGNLQYEGFAQKLLEIIQQRGGQ